MLTALLRTAYDLVAPRQHDSALGIIHADFPDGERRFLFAVPSRTEALKNKKGLRLLGGVGENNETPVQTLFRELREELVGHDTMKGIEEGRMMPISELQDNALSLLRRKQTEMEKQTAPDKLWSYHYNYNPDRFNERQKNWARSANHIYELRLTPDEFRLLENVGRETTQRDHKELSNVSVMTEREIRGALSRHEKFMGYAGEIRSLGLFLKSPQGLSPAPAAP